MLSRDFSSLPKCVFLLHTIIVLLAFTANSLALSWWSSLISSESDGMSLPAKRSACTLEEWNDESMKVACLKREAQLEPVMRRGAQEAISECQRLFKVEKWNCSVNRRDRTIFGRSVVGVPTKEAAFIDALMSASLVHHIAQGCAKGTLGTACSCGEVLPYTVGGETLSWFWGNCSVNVKYGQQFVERLSYPPRYQQPSKLPQTDLIRLLNSATGRRMVNSVQLIKCKCHGLSTACAFKTCWRALPKFSTVSITLKDRYFDARRINVTRQSPHRAKWVRLAKYIINHRERKLAGNTWDLVYSAQSPNYCHQTGNGNQGTSGRPCLHGENNRLRPDSCQNLCCGRGSYRVPVKQTVCCEDSFHLAPEDLQGSYRCLRLCTHTWYRYYCR